MSKGIEAMKAEGWNVVYVATPEYAPENEAITFNRPRQKPNAVVNWTLVEAFDYWANTIARPLPCGAEIPKDMQDAIRNLRQAITRLTD